MTRQEVFDRVDHAIKNGKKRDRCELLDVIFYQKGSGQTVGIVEYYTYGGRTFNDEITIFTAGSPTEAIAKAISRHANPDKITHDAQAEVGNANARIEKL